MPKMSQVLRESAIGMLTVGMSTRAIAREFVSTSTWPHNHASPEPPHPASSPAGSSETSQSGYFNKCVLVVLTCILTWLQFGIVSHLWWPLAWWRTVLFTYGVVWASVLLMSMLWTEWLNDGCGVMVWARINYGQQIELCFNDGYLDAQIYRGEILNPIVVPFICRHHLMFQHDNARPHVARIWTQFLEAENVPVLPWPVYSSDMSPVEHVWNTLDRCVPHRVPVHANIQQLCTATKRCGTTFHIQQPDQLYAKEMCRAAWGKWWSHQILTGFMIHNSTV
jgi:hypothetical protein